MVQATLKRTLIQYSARFVSPLPIQVAILPLTNKARTVWQSQLTFPVLQSLAPLTLVYAHVWVVRRAVSVWLVCFRVPFSSVFNTTIQYRGRTNLTHDSATFVLTGSGF